MVTSAGCTRTPLTFALVVGAADEQLAIRVVPAQIARAVGFQSVAEVGEPNSGQNQSPKDPTAAAELRTGFGTPVEPEVDQMITPSSG